MQPRFAILDARRIGNRQSCQVEEGPHFAICCKMGTQKNLEVPDCLNYHITLQEKSNQRLSG